MTSIETASEVTLSLTGWDEIAIAQRFGCDYTRMEDRPLMLLRAMMFVVERRNGAKDAEAYKTAMNATGVEVGNYFPDEPDDEDEAGKGSVPSQ